MGMFDEVDIDGHYGQVKCWITAMISFKKGDFVGEISPGEKTYSVAMREGGFLNIKNNILDSWTSNHESDIIYDKWGYRVYEEELSVFQKEGYLYPEEELEFKMVK